MILFVLCSPLATDSATGIPVRPKQNELILKRVEVDRIGVVDIRIKGPKRRNSRAGQIVIEIVKKESKGERPVKSFKILSDFPNALTATYAKVDMNSLLAVQGDGGQFRFTTVYLLNYVAGTLVPVSEPIIMGDTSELWKGIVVEWSPSRYVDPKPPGFHPGNNHKEILLRRVWKFDAKERKFTPGRYAN